MPALIPIAAGAYIASSAAVIGIFGHFGAALLGALASVAATQLLGLGPRRPSGGFEAEVRDRQVVIRSAIEPRRVIYGEVGGLAGPLAFGMVSREFSETQASEDHWVPWYGAPPFIVTGKNAAAYRSTVAVYVVQFIAGGGDSMPSETLTELTAVGGAPADGQYSVAAGVYTFNIAQSGHPVRIVYRHTTSQVTNSFLHLVIPLAGHLVQEIGDVMFGEDTIASSDLDAAGNVVSGKYAHYVRIKKYLGTAEQQADPDLIAESGGKWTAAHRGRGVAYIYVRLRRNPDLFVHGVPNIRAKGKGALFFDPRTSSTAWSDNWGLAVYDYLTKSYGLGCAASEVDTTLINAAANVADENVAIDAVGGTQKRYTVNGTFSLDERPLDVLKHLVVAGAGAAVYSVSTWDVYAGAYVAPTASLTVSDLRGPITGRADLERKDLFNAVRGKFVDPTRDWQPTDFPPVRNASYVADDNGEEIYRDIELLFVTDAIRGQRLGKIVLERARQATQCMWLGKPKLFQRNTFETLNVTVPQLGWSPKVMRVMGWGWQPGAAVDLLLQEDAAAIYDWNFGEALDHDPAPNTTLPNSGPVAPPGAPTVSEVLIETTGARNVSVKITIACEPSADLYVDRYQFEYKALGASAWISLPWVSDPRTEVFDLEAGTYEFRVRARTGLGRTSIFSQATSEVLGLTAKPATPTIRGLQVAGNLAILTLDESVDLDVLRGGRVLVRHSEDTAAPAWEASFSIGEEKGYPGGATVIVLPLKAGTYLVRFEDVVFQQSVSATIQTKQASVLAYSTVSTLQEETTFPGTHASTVAIDGVLKLSGAGLFDDIPDMDAVSSLDDYGGSVASGTYTFSAGFDFGAVARRRFTGQLEGVIVNVNDLIDSRTENIDDWADFDGANAGAGDAYLEFRETDDDPAGAPAWSAWKRLDAAEVECRGAEFRLQMLAHDAAYNVNVDLLRVKAAQVV